MVTSMTDNLVSRAEIAEMLGVTGQTVHRYSGRPDFPKPVGQLAAGRVWRRKDVEKWAAKTLPLPSGRPRKSS
jgi:predicted DNA-binding transcriptional regulator AlpA